MLEMDPTSAALIASATLIARETASEAVKDAYHGLKDLIRGKLGGGPEADVVLDNLDSKPEVWSEPLRDLLQTSTLISDPDIILSASNLSRLIGISLGAVEDRNVQVGTMNIAGDTYIIGGDFANDSFQHQESVREDQQKGEVLLELATQRGDGFRLRNNGYKITDHEGLSVWRVEVLDWNNRVAEKMSALDPIDAEIFKVLGNIPIREYPNTEFVNDQHLLFLRVLDERLTRLDRVISKHHDLLIQ